MSTVMESPIVTVVPESAVNGYGEYFTVVARVGFVVKAVDQFLLMSMVVEFVVPAVPTHISAPNSFIGSNIT